MSPAAARRAPPGTQQRGGAALLAAALAVALLAAGARAHVVYGTTTLRLRTLQADLVVRARVVDPAQELLLRDAGVREAVVAARVLEVFKGEAPEERLRFVQHGHGAPRYEAGEEIVLFLRHIERSRELSATPVARRIPWVSVQEADGHYRLDDASRPRFTAALRSYAALERLPAEGRPAALRHLTVSLLNSPDATLAASALRDVVLSAEAPIVTAQDLPALEPLLASPATPIGLRVALLAELERRGLVEGPARWARLVRESSGRDRFTAVRAVVAHPSPAVTAELVRLLASDDPLLVATAAISLGSPGNASAVEPLAKLLASDDGRVRLAAIRGLGRIATPAAREPLARAAANHPDPATRRRARAEAAILAGPAPRRGP